MPPSTLVAMPCPAMPVSSETLLLLQVFLPPHLVMILLACVPSPDGYNFERNHAKLKYSENRLSALHLSICWLAMLNEKPEEQTEYRAAGLQYCEDHQESGEVEVI